MQLASLPAWKYATVAHLGVEAALAEIAQRPTPVMFLRELDDLIDQLAALPRPSMRPIWRNASA